MGRLISCEFNRDTVCIELKFTDGSMIAIDMNTVENEVADNTMPVGEILRAIFHIFSVNRIAFSLILYYNKSNDVKRMF